jgi:hypothetical protein
MLHLRRDGRLCDGQTLRANTFVEHKVADETSSQIKIIMKVKLFFFLTVSIIPNLLFAQYMQQGLKLTGTGEVGKGELGASVSISSDGNTAIVGGDRDNATAGAVWIFTRSGGAWVQQGQKLVGTEAVGTTSFQGCSVSISADGNTAIEGGYNDNNSIGAAWIFTRSGGVWTQQGPKLVGTGSVASGEQGYSVAISGDGNTAIMGGPVVGGVWIFTRTDTGWAQQGPMLAGTDAVNAGMGNAVAISSDGNTAIAGGDQDGFNQGSSQGACWVFIRNGGAWTQQGPKLIAAGPVYATQGFSVSISADGNTAMEGGPTDNGSEGCVGIFTRSSGVWAPQAPDLVGNGSIISDLGFGGNNVLQGTSVALSPDGNTAIEGGSEDNSYVGAVWVFTRADGAWTQLGTKLVGSDTIGNAVHGLSVSISSNGTIIESGAGDNGGAGAVWVFTNPNAGVTPTTSELQNDINLSQNSPNPFNSSTVIKFNVPSSGFVTLIVYNVFGKEVATIVNEHLEAGAYQVDFDGSTIATGTYFYRLETEDFAEIKKMILAK